MICLFQSHHYYHYNREQGKSEELELVLSLRTVFVEGNMAAIAVIFLKEAHHQIHSFIAPTLISHLKFVIFFFSLGPEI